MNGTQPWNSMSGGACSNLGHVPKDMNGGVPVTTTNSSGPSVGVSSLVTDANSSLSGGAQLQQSTSMNADSFMRIPASPMSFSSNNISGSSAVNKSIMQQSLPQELVQKRRSSSVTSQPVYEAGDAAHPQKKSRIDVRQDDNLQHQLIQQLLHGQNSLHLQGQQNAQLQTLIQQHKLQQISRQLQHYSQPFSQIQRPQVGIPLQPQLRPPVSRPGMQLSEPVRVPVVTGLCSRRLMQYLYHKRHRPENNTITYWKKLVEEYFAPQARERWCVSSYEKRGNSSVATPHTTRDAWHCDICNAHDGKGYEASYEVLPRLCQIKFDHGVIDEYMYLDMPNEFRLANGQMLLEHAKVIQRSVYEHQHVTHEGHLRIIFTPELKVMSWEFCARRHEEYITRRILAPQVNNLLQVAQKYQAAVSGSGQAGVSNNDVQTIGNMFVTASQQLAKNLDHHTLNQHGLSKRYGRCLQILEVVNQMKDLIEFSNKTKIGPKESLSRYCEQTVSKLPVQNMNEARQSIAAAGLPNNQSNINVMGTQQEISSHMNNGTPGLGDIGNNSPQNAAALIGYQNMFRSSGANQSCLQQEASRVFRGPGSMHSGMQMELSRSFNVPNQVQLVQFQHSPSFQKSMPQHNSIQGLGASPHYHQHLLNQLMQEIRDNNHRTFGQQQLPGTPNVNSSHESGVTFNSAATREQTQGISNNNDGINRAAPVSTVPSNVINSKASTAPSRSNSFKSVSSNPVAATGGNASTSKAAESFYEMEDLSHLISSELAESGLFREEQGGEFSWDI